MNTTLYIMRHANKLTKWGIDYRTDSNLLRNKAIVLTVAGERSAELVSSHPELLSIDAIWVSDYVRTMQTAKYVAYYNNDLKINIHPDLGERIKGTIATSKEEFIFNQWRDPHYKVNDGESRFEVTARMKKVINNILNLHRGQRILVVSHTTAINFWWYDWCQVNLEKKSLTYKNKQLANNFKIKTASLYKVTFDKNLNLMDIEYLI